MLKRNESNGEEAEATAQSSAYLKFYDCDGKEGGTERR